VATSVDPPRPPRFCRSRFHWNKPKCAPAAPATNRIKFAREAGGKKEGPAEGTGAVKPGVTAQYLQDAQAYEQFLKQIDARAKDA